MNTLVPHLVRYGWIAIAFGGFASGALTACASNATDGNGGSSSFAGAPVQAANAGSTTAMPSAGSGSVGGANEGGAGAAVGAIGGASNEAGASQIEIGGAAVASGGEGGTSGAARAGAGAAGAAHGGAASGSAGGSGVAAGGAPPSNCSLPAIVGFQKDVQPFLTSSCGKAVSGGCHVTDGSKTSLGYDHAYDWITAIAHTGSCGKTPPYAKRFEVVLAVIAGANPASCPNSRKMPPPGMGTPLSACQVAALRAWLSEPMVSQMHVPETDETKDLYPPGPYLMPPFN